MGILRYNYRSQSLGRYVDVTVTIPSDGYSYCDMSKRGPSLQIPGTKPREWPMLVPGMKFQTIYLIHGGGDDDTLTYRFTRAEEYAGRNKVMLVTPNITNSFGADTSYGVKYMTFVTEELPVLIQTLFPSSPKREDNFIMGYAMGGNAALGAALMHPHRYAECVDISGGIGFTPRTDLLREELESDHFKNGFRLYGSTFGDSEKLAGSQYDLYAVTMKNLKDGVPLPKLHMVLGSDEFIFARVKGDYDKLVEMGCDVELTIEPGGNHDFDLWDKYIKIAMEQILPLRREAINPEGSK